MIVPGLSNRAAGLFWAERLYPWHASTFNQIPIRLGPDYDPALRLILESRTRSSGGGAWNAWTSETRTRSNPTVPPTIAGTATVETEYRWRHPVPRLTGYLKIDWHRIVLEYLAAADGSVREYSLDKIEFRPRWTEFGRQDRLVTYNKRKSLPTAIGVANAVASGLFTGGNSFRFDWTNAASRVFATPANESQFFVGVDKRFWWNTWAPEALAYAELNGEFPAQSPKLRFQPVFFEDRDYGWYWRQIAGLSGQRPVRGWVALDDTSAVTNIFGASLKDPADGSFINSSLQILNGKITALGTASMTLPTGLWAANAINSVPFGAITIFDANGSGTIIARGIPAGPGLREATRIEYVWDGTVPTGYDPFRSDTWPVSPTYSLPGYPSEGEVQPASKINMPFWYTRAGDAAVVVDV